MANQVTHATQSTNLADILERVLDKGIVIAGDIRIKLADIELLTIKIRLLVASVERAQQMGINWWETDPSLSSRTETVEQENAELRQTVAELDKRIRQLEHTDLSLITKRNQSQKAE